VESGSGKKRPKFERTKPRKGVFQILSSSHARPEGKGLEQLPERRKFTATSPKAPPDGVNLDLVKQLGGGK